VSFFRTFSNWFRHDCLLFFRPYGSSGLSASPQKSVLPSSILPWSKTILSPFLGSSIPTGRLTSANPIAHRPFQFLVPEPVLQLIYGNGFILN
jgi:hypothetical protein